MTNDQINQRIAETCGWKCAKHPDQLKATEGWEFGYRMVIRPDGQLVTHDSIPNYCECLNAMHEAEQYLWNENYSLRFDFIDELGKLLQPTVWHRINATDSLDATARQRAEAFLRTIGKWEEVVFD